MKSLFVLSAIFIGIAGLLGCAEVQPIDIPSPQEMMAVVVAELESATSFEMTSKETTATRSGDYPFESTFTKEEKTIAEPYISWQRQIYDAGMNATTLEDYEFFNGENYESYYRFAISDNEKPIMKPITEWSNLKVEVDENEIVGRGREKNAFLYLLSESADRFNEGKAASVGTKVLVKYDGTIHPDVLINAYIEYLRDPRFAIEGSADTENFGSEDALEEIIYNIDQGKQGLTEGIPEMCFAKDPIPISLWVDSNDPTFVKFSIDKTACETDISNALVVTDPEFVYESVTLEVELRLNHIKEIPLPDEIKAL